MSSASQGPGWWQASDGKWYSPEQRAGYVAPPPPAPAQTSFPPPASPYPSSAGFSASLHNPAPGTPAFGNAQATFGAAVVRIPRAAWIVVGGLVAALFALFLPLANVSAEGIFSIDVYWPGWAKFIGFLFVAGGLALTWLTYDRLQTQQITLMGLSAVVGLMIAHLILNWLTYDSETKGKGDMAGVAVSPGFGLLLYTLGLGVAAAGIVLIWKGRSTPQPRSY